MKSINHSVVNMATLGGILLAGGLAMISHKRNFKQKKNDIIYLYTIYYEKLCNCVFKDNPNKYHILKKELVNAKSMDEISVILEILDRYIANYLNNERIEDTDNDAPEPDDEMEVCVDDEISDTKTFTNEFDYDSIDDTLNDGELTSIPVDVPVTQEEGFESGPIDRISENLMYLCDDDIDVLDFITFIEKMNELKDIDEDKFNEYVNIADSIPDIDNESEQKEQLAELIKTVNEDAKLKAHISR